MDIVQLDNRRRTLRQADDFAGPPCGAVAGDVQEVNPMHHRRIGRHRLYRGRQGRLLVVVIQEDDDRLLYGGLGGEIACLDLRSGRARTLRELPGRPVIRALALSRDGSSLACTTVCT